MFFSKIPIYFSKIASFLPFFFFSYRFCIARFPIINVIFVFFFFSFIFRNGYSKKKRKKKCALGFLDESFYFSYSPFIYTRLARFLTNYKRGFTICQTFWLSLRYITCCKCRWHGTDVASCKYIYIYMYTPRIDFIRTRHEYETRVEIIERKCVLCPADYTLSLRIKCIPEIV